MRHLFLSIFAALGFTVLAGASEIDIFGPPDSLGFGWYVTALPNGNIVIQDPFAGSDSQGAVYLYSPTGTLISALRGSSPQDYVGPDPVIVLPSGNFLVASYDWNNGSASNAGAVTWVNGKTGLDGVVSPENSLVGSSTDDQVGSRIVVLANGNYVVSTYNWNNGSVPKTGAVTFEPADGSVRGAVSASNSLVGVSAYDYVGADILALTNGNYLVVSPRWSNGATASVGAVTWASGETGIAGTISAQNSLVGGTEGDALGGDGFEIKARLLSNGSAVVLSPGWDNGSLVDAGAVTWINGATGLTGLVSQTNSLVGSSAGDAIGDAGVFNDFAELPGERYAVVSPSWSSTGGAHVGAITWCDSSTGTSGVVSAANSLVGSTTDDLLGAHLYPLRNGNWVVASSRWSAGAVEGVGAVTWIDAAAPLLGPISAANSLVGSTAGDAVGLSVTPLSNGHYVVASPFWSNAGIFAAGAATWVDGTKPRSGEVTAINSLVGSRLHDNVGQGADGVVALTNGNYVVLSPSWNNGAIQQVGAVTWARGDTAIAGPVSVANSLVGNATMDNVGLAGTALANGNAVIGSWGWHDGTGAATWMDGSTGLIGTVSGTNSLIGSVPGDSVSFVTRIDATGNYLVAGKDWSNGDTYGAGAVAWGNARVPIVGEVSASNAFVGTHFEEAMGYSVTTYANGNAVITSENTVTLARGTSPLTGTATVENSVFAFDPHQGIAAFDYDATHDRLVVGWFRSNYVAIFQAELLFKNGFD